MVVTESIRYVEEEAARRIVALDATKHSSATLTAEWHESREPLTAVEATTGYTHLSFTASVESAPFAEDGSGQPGHFLTLELDLVVVFMYRIPASGGVAALRLASVAALEVVAALLAGWHEVNVTPRQAYKPGPISNGWMPVETRFVVLIDTAI